MQMYGLRRQRIRTVLFSLGMGEKALLLFKKKSIVLLKIIKLTAIKTIFTYTHFMSMRGVHCVCLAL